MSKDKNYVFETQPTPNQEESRLGYCPAGMEQKDYAPAAVVSPPQPVASGPNQMPTSEAPTQPKPDANSSGR